LFEKDRKIYKLLVRQREKEKTQITNIRNKTTDMKKIARECYKQLSPYINSTT
jgi:translation initiation factor 1 (eIF-1/SUI1)